MMQNSFNKIINFCLKYGIKIIAIIVGIIGILSIFISAYFQTTFYHPDEKTFFKYSIGIVEILVTIFVFALIALISRKILKKIPSKILIVLLLIASSILFIFWVKTLKLNPETDQKMIHDMALYFLDGNISHHLETAQYLFFYPYQFGLTFFVSLIYKFFGTDYMNILLVNCICSTINIFILFYLSKLIFKNENIQKILIFLLGGFSLLWMFFNPHFYGNIIGLTLALASVLFTTFYLDNKKHINLVLSGIFIALSIIIKTNYQIFLCGIVLVLLFDIIKKWNIKNLVLVILTFIIGYASINLGYSQIQKISNVELPEGIPMISFIYMGMDEPTVLSPGWYNGVTVDIFKDNSYNVAASKEESKQLILERLSYFFNNPNEALSYYTEKIGSTWLNPTFQTIWCSLPGTRYRWYPEYAHYLGYHETLLSMVGGDLYKKEEFIFEIYQILIFIFASIGIYRISNSANAKQSLLLIIFAGGFLFHIIWETKSIYVIQYYFLLLPFAAYGINFIIEKLTKIKFKKEK